MTNVKSVSMRNNTEMLSMKKVSVLLPIKELKLAHLHNVKTLIYIMRIKTLNCTSGAELIRMGIRVRQKS